MVALLLLISLLLVRLPSVIGPGTVGLSLLPAVVCLGGGHLLLLGRRKLQTSRALAALYGLMVALIVIAYYRGGLDAEIYTQRQAMQEVAAVALLGLFAFNGILAEPDAEDRRRRIVAVCFAPAVFVAGNELLYGLGVRAPANPASIGDSGSAELLSLLGVSTQRISFPYGEGINGFGVMAGVAFVASFVPLIRMSGGLRLAGALGIVVAVYGLLAADGRGPFLFAIAVSFALLVAPKVIASGARGLPLVIPFAPAIIVAALGLFAGTSVSSTFARGNFDFASATGRTDIWSAVTSALSHFDLIHLVGWGFGGQLSSGVSYAYAYVVATNGRPEFATAHNFLLQSILDVGYLGTLVFLAVFVFGLRSAGRELRRKLDTGATMIVGVLVYLLLVGTLESAPGASTPAALDALLLVAACAFAYERPSAPPESAIRDQAASGTLSKVGV